MGRHSAPRRHGHVVIVGAVALVGSAGIAWAVGEDGTQAPRTPERTQSTAESTAPLDTAPTPVPTGSSTPVVLVVPSPTPSPTATGQAVPSTEPAPDPTPSAEPTRTKPGKGVPPTPRPTRSKK
jgi:hypothetical protein